MQRKRFGVVLVFLIGIVGSAGCPGNRTSPTGPRHAGVVLRVAAPAGAAAELLRQRGATWAAPHGARVTLLPYERPAEPPAAEVWVTAAAELPRWAAAGKLAPVPESLHAANGDYEWNRLLPLYRGKLLLWGSTTAYAVPLLGESPLCFYRTDLLGDAAAAEEFRKQFGKALAPPATWEDFARIAEFFRGRKAAGLGEASLPPLPADPEALDRLFYQAAAPYVRPAEAGRAGEKEDADLFSFHYDLQSGRPRLREGGFVAALQLHQRLQACRPKKTADDPAAEFVAGRAVLCLADAPILERCRHSAMRDKVGVCRVPGTEAVVTAVGQRRAVEGGNVVPYVGAASWLAVVPKTAEHAEAAWEMLAEVTGPEGSRQTVMEPSHGGGAVRTQHLEHPKYVSGFGLGPAQTQKMLEALRQTLTPAEASPVVRLRIPEERTRVEALTAELRRALTEGKDAAAALDTAAARWETLDRQRPTHLADYYRSLGLEPPP